MRIGSGTGQANGRCFIVAMLLALAATIVPALCPTGLPATRLRGSAFDPTTSIVALRGRAQPVMRAASAQDEGKDKGLHPLNAILLPMSGAVLAAARRAAATPFAEPPAPALPRRALISAQPRAPPVSV